MSFSISQTPTYDPASNVISLSMSLPAVPGYSGSGGSEVSNFCYDEQNRLVWAGNSGTQPGAGILLVQFLPGIFTFFTQVQQGSLHPDAITFLGVGAFILICIGAFVNMYYYIKARRRRKTS